MDVILLERVEKLGAIGDVVTVKPGFARNYLLPRGKALRATEGNRKKFEADRARIEAENAKRRDIARSDAKDMDGVTVVMIRQASSSGQLYGSAAARDLAEALTSGGHKVSRSQIVLDAPIKALGLHKVKVALHPEVIITVTVNVARSAEEAELQAKGVDVTADKFERDEAGFTEEFDASAEPGIPAEAPAAAPAAEDETPAEDA
ncbi:MAG: 50S ribosomal protein L9 [Polymorphobacter sp.]|uniref:50S ribosomal protein L9 n=1 Tax=Polymorphobacter sp. TaxID=1909290 RepID=UPI003A86A0D1